MITIPILLVIGLEKPKIEKIETPPAIVEVVKETPEPIPTPPPAPVVTWRDNPMRCDTVTQHIAAEPPYYCIDKKIKPKTNKTSKSYVSSPGNTYVPGNCTHFTKSQLGWVRNGWGDARNWASSARSQGFPVNSSPSVGSVAQTTSGRLGHVAVVIGVSGDMVTLREMNYEGLFVVSTRTVHKSQFIYIHSI